jgi:hypothetical protein
VARRRARGFLSLKAGRSGAEIGGVAADDRRLDDALTELLEQDGYAVERKPCPDEGADLTLLREGVRMAVQAEAAAPPPDPTPPRRGRTA